MSGKIVLIIVSVFVLAGIFFIAKHAQLRKFSMISEDERNTVTDRYLLIFSIIVIPVTLLFDANFLNYRKPIPFSEIERINFTDFRGWVRPACMIKGVDEFAAIATHIVVRRKGEKVYVESFFYPSRSYVFNRRLFNNILLKHELYHFRITEYHARLMRQEIGYTPGARNPKPLNRIKYHIRGELEDMQTKYDYDTSHGCFQPEQIRWQSKIDSLLNTLNDYSEPIVAIKKDNY